jgi:CubicO group peptidase (beta-lactamase class C family)
MAHFSVVFFRFTRALLFRIPMSDSATNIVLGALLPCLLASMAMADGSPQSITIPARIETAVEKLNALAQKTLNSTGVPGIAIAVVYKNQVIYKKGFGVREAGKPERVDADTVFQVASMSKPISSTVLAALVGEKRIDWDDRVIDRDPGFCMYEPFVTRELRLRDLLCHRSGLPDHCGDLLEDIGYDRPEIFRRLRYQPPASSFRAEYAYNNFGYSEACLAAAKASGEAWEDLAAKKLFTPLGMASTSFRFADYAKAANRAKLHVRANGNNSGKWTAKNTRQPDAQAPAGGASTTLNDLVRWMRLQLNEGKFEGRQLIAASALAETHTPQIVTGFTPKPGRVSSYGLGWNIGVERGGRVFWRHSGAFSLGMRTEVAMLPSEDIAITVLSNAAPTGVPEGLTESFFDWVLDGKLQRDWVEFANRMFDEEVKKELGEETDFSHPPEKPTPPLKLSAYAGKYANDFFGPIELTEQKGKLVLRVGPKPIEFDLRHWDRDTFIYQPTGESAGGPAGVRFSIAPDRQSDRVLIKNLNIHGQGTFPRVK